MEHLIYTVVARRVRLMVFMMFPPNKMFDGCRKRQAASYLFRQCDRSDSIAALDGGAGEA